MNLIIIHPDEIRNNMVELSDRRGDHVRKVIRPAEGDSLRIGILDGPRGLARVVRAGTEVTLEIVRLEAEEPRPEVVLVAALPRPIMLRRVLAQAAAFGVSELHLINAARVEKSFFSSSLVSQEKWEEFLLQGLEQGGRTRLPQVRLHRRFRPFAEDILPELAATCATRLIAHPQERPKCPADMTAPVIAAVGPEGGWNEFELGCFIAAGFSPFSMGATIMRVDWAVPAILAFIESSLG